MPKKGINITKELFKSKDVNCYTQDKPECHLCKEQSYTRCSDCKVDYCPDHFKQHLHNCDTCP